MVSEIEKACHQKCALRGRFWKKTTHYRLLEKQIMSSRLRNLLFYWLPPIAFCALIYIQSSHPSPVKLPSFFLSDKMVHFGLYALMGILFYRAYKTLPVFAFRSLPLILSSIASASLYGISDEIHQHFVPFRQADFFDVVADSLGAACGVYLYHFWLLRKDVGAVTENKEMSAGL